MPGASRQAVGSLRPVACPTRVGVLRELRGGPG